MSNADTASTGKKYHVNVSATRANLVTLSEMELDSNTPLTLNLTCEQYEALPSGGDMRRALVVVCEKLGVEHAYTSENMDPDLQTLLECYNDENEGARKYENTVKADDLNLEDTLKALNVIAACCDEENRIRPWEASTSVTEALADVELEPDVIFKNPKVPLPNG